MEQAGRDANFVKPHIGEDICDLQRMHKIWFARSPFLSLVMDGRKKVGPPDQLDVRVPAVCRYLIYDVFYSDQASASPNITFYRPGLSTFFEIRRSLLIKK